MEELHTSHIPIYTRFLECIQQNVKLGGCYFNIIYIGKSYVSLLKQIIVF